MNQKTKPDSKEASTKPQRGRPVTGEAKTPTQRASAFDAALVASGGRILSRVRLSPEAADALRKLSEHYGSDRAGIEAALLDHILNVALNDK
jgi:hypothetical protein